MSKWFLQLESTLVRAGFTNAGNMSLEQALGHLEILYEQNKPKEESTTELYNRLGGK